MMERLIDRPKPMPVALVVENGLNMRSANSGGKPGPVSFTPMTTKLGSAGSSAADSRISRQVRGDDRHGLHAVAYQI